MKLKHRMAAVAAVAALIGGTAAQGHTSFVLPAFFTASEEGFVTVQSGFAEHFFQTDVAVDSPDFHIVLPDGTRAGFERITRLRQVTVLETPLAQDGTFRFTTGVRRGQVGKLALVNGMWETVRDDVVPAGATMVRTSQTETVADAYMTRKAPTRAPVDVAIGRLVVKPVTHPSDVAVGEPFELQVLFDGQPLAGQQVELDRGNSRYEEQQFHQIATTDAEGRVALGFDQPGVYVLMTRHRADAPAGSETQIRSYTTSLTFEVQP